MGENKMITVPTKSALEALVNHEKGEVALCEEDQTYYVYNEVEGWMPIPAKMTAEGLTIDLYSLNKQIVAQLPPFDEQRIKDAKETLENWKKGDRPYLLYGREISYFTLFSPVYSVAEDEKDYDSFVENVFACLADLTDEIYSFDVVGEDAIEIWIKYNDEATALYLFDYSEGLVYYYG